MNAYEPTREPGWFKSSYSDHGNACVEVRFEGENALLRDSKYQGLEEVRPIITVPVVVWSHFLQAAMDNTDSRRAMPGHPAIQHTASGETTITDADGTSLSYTAAEWAAFISGVRAGEFSSARPAA
ncbi:DUF397 domain-containing protein [Nocardia callitridis]